MHINFLDIVKEIHLNYSDNSQNIRRTFAAIINKRQYLPEELSSALNQIKYTYSMNRSRYNIPVPPYREVFDSFLLTCKNTLTPRKNALFLRYLSIYATGRISHRVFIRLFIETVGLDKEKLLPLLPQFLSAINSGSFLMEKRAIDDSMDELAVELAVSATAMAESEEAPKSLSKCLKLMSEGVIRPDVAKKWLRNFCTPEVMKKLNTVDDFSVFHPGSLPSDILMSNGFNSSAPPKNVFELYHDGQHRRYDPHSLRPVVIDILLLKMREIRKLIMLLTLGEKVDAKSLSFIYGDEKASDIANNMSNYNIPVVMRLVDLFTNCRNELISILCKKMRSYEADHFEYRILYKKMMNHNTFAFFYELPGCRTISFGTKHTAEVAIAVLRFYARKVLGEEEIAKVEDSLQALLPLFSDDCVGKYFVVNEKPIHSIVYLAEIAERIKLQGNVEEVLVTPELLLQPVSEQGPYGKDLYSMIDHVKDDEHAMKGFMAVCDITLVRALRSLYSMESSKLDEFPEGIEQVNLYMTMTQISEPQFGIMCSSAFSPCFTEASFIKEEK